MSNSNSVVSNTLVRSGQYGIVDGYFITNETGGGGDFFKIDYINERAAVKSIGHTTYMSLSEIRNAGTISVQILDSSPDDFFLRSIKDKLGFECIFSSIMSDGKIIKYTCHSCQFGVLPSRVVNVENASDGYLLTYIINSPQIIETIL
jgi:hypothetical protein